MKRIYNNNEPDDFFDKDYLENMDGLNDDEDDENDYDDIEEFMTYIDIDALKKVISEEIEEVVNKDTNLLLAVRLAQEKFLWKYYTEQMQMESIERIFIKLEEIRNSSLGKSQVNPNPLMNPPSSDVS